ncbi:MAG: TraM recognition domain-containing protein [Micrococcaceae bacterium]|nr:TraM recognition domain-containing protein [Micrococcaceae bacterium]
MSWHTETQRTSTLPPGTAVPLLVLAGVAVYGVYVLVGNVMNRLFCEHAAWPAGMFEPLGFILSGDTTVFGAAGQCAASPVATTTALIAMGVVVVAVGLLIFFARHRYLQSDKFFIKDLRRREGIARAPEVRKAVGTKTTKTLTKKVRPSLNRPDAGDGALRLGASDGVPVWASLEESICLIGPPRSGKGLHLLIGAILDAPGPVVTTSSRADNYAATASIRRRTHGPVALFDPQGLTDTPTTLKWSPITGCEVPRVANQRAVSLIGASGLGASSSNQEWQAPATTIMECLLHAAALDDRTVDELMRWGNNPAEAKEAIKILSEHPRAAQGWNLVLQGIVDGDPKLLQSKWFGVEGAVKGLSVPEVRDVLKPQHDVETLNIDEFLEQNGTLYVLGTKSGGSSAGPFLIAMMDAITERAREMAAKRPGNRLDPPLSLVLDEIANISVWPGLTQLMSDGGGVGISVFAVFQSLAQARNEWGNEQATALFDSATIKAQLGGASNTDDLRLFSDLAGSRQVIRFSRSSGKESSSESDQLHDLDVLKVDELRRLPFGWSVMFYRNRRPFLIQLVKWPDRADAKEIKAALGAYNRDLLAELESGEDAVSLNSATDQPARGTSTDDSPEIVVR